MWREAELMHGRVGMMAALGFLVQESKFHPFMPQVPDVPAIFQLSKITPEYAALLVSFIGFTEIARAKRGWVRPKMDTESTRAMTVRTLKSTYQPGDLGFDPLNLMPKDPKAREAMQAKELNNGRLGMLAAAGAIGQELATGQGLFAAA